MCLRPAILPRHGDAGLMAMPGVADLDRRLGADDLQTAAVGEVKPAVGVCEDTSRERIVATNAVSTPAGPRTEDAVPDTGSPANSRAALTG